MKNVQVQAIKEVRSKRIVIIVPLRFVQTGYDQRIELLNLFDLDAPDLFSLLTSSTDGFLCTHTNIGTTGFKCSFGPVVRRNIPRVEWA